MSADQLLGSISTRVNAIEETGIVDVAMYGWGRIFFLLGPLNYQKSNLPGMIYYLLDLNESFDIDRTRLKNFEMPSRLTLFREVPDDEEADPDKVGVSASLQLDKFLRASTSNRKSLSRNANSINKNNRSSGRRPSGTGVDGG